jgi:hypothetical protein
MDHNCPAAQPRKRSATEGETRMGLLDWLRPRTPASAPELEVQQMVTNVPSLSDPILLFMENPALVPLLEEVPSWQVVHTRSFGEFSAVLPERKYAMLIALSPLGGRTESTAEATESLSPRSGTRGGSWFELSRPMTGGRLARFSVRRNKLGMVHC